MSSNFKYTSGLRSVGSYQVSGHPFITGSIDLDTGKVHGIMFPYVCKSFTVINNNTGNGEEKRVHFQSGSSTAVTVPGDGGAQTIGTGIDVVSGFHYITVPAGNASVTMNVKCSKFYISQATGTNNLKYQVFAELTSIPTGSMYHLTGSGITEAPNT